MGQAWIEKVAGAGRGWSDAARAEEPALDPAVILSLWDVGEGDGHFVQDLLELYVDQALEIIVGMRAALHANDHRSFRRGAHKLAGSSLYAGAVAVATICHELESSEGGGAASSGMEALESAVRRVVAAIAGREWLRAAVAV